MAAQTWYTNPTYHNPALDSDIIDSDMDLDIDLDVESSMATASASALHGAHHLKKKLVSNLPPFDVPPKKIRSTAYPLSVRIQAKRDVCLTTGLVEGDLEISCLKESCAPKLGKIAVYLVGFEETRQAKTRNFLLKKWIIQDQRFAPSDAVHAGILDEDGMWNARKGTTTFPFAIPFQRSSEIEDGAPSAVARHITTELESDSPLPSSYWNQQIGGGVRYVLAGVAENKVGGKIRNPLAFYHEIFVVEGAGYTLAPTFANLSARTQPLLREARLAVTSGFLGFGRKGEVELAASLRTLRILANTQEPGVWRSGDAAFVGIDITNKSPKKVVRLEVSLIRILKTFKFDSVGYRPVSFSRMVAAKTTRIAAAKATVQRGTMIRESVANGWQESQGGNQTGSWLGVLPDNSLKVLVTLDVPKWARSVRYASLVDVSYEVHAKITTVGGKSVQVNIPITILHPSSVLEESAKIDILAPPEIKNDGVAGHVSYVNVEPATDISLPLEEVVGGERGDGFAARVLHKDEEPLPLPQPISIKPLSDPAGPEEPVFNSQMTLADSASSLGDRLSETSPITTSTSPTKRASTLTARKTAGPLKSFMAVSRASTARRAGPVVSRPSPASLKAMSGTSPSPGIDAPSVVDPRNGGAQRIKDSIDLDIDGVAKFDLDSEIDKMFAVVQME